LRCKLVATVEGQPTYHISPLLDRVDPVGLGGVVPGHHAERAPAELLGLSTGEPGQSFQVRRTPVLARRPTETVRVVPPRNEPELEPTVTEWREVADFSDATAEDRVFTWSGATGEIRFGPRVLDREGRPRQYGAIVDEDAQIFVTGYRHGGGRRGNVGAGKLSVLLTSIPSVDGVRNLDPARDGVDPESVENAKVRGPLYLRGGQRAVTARDFERLTLEAAPGVARARCLAPQAPGEPARLLVVPRVDEPPETLALHHLQVPESLENTIKSFLDERRLLTTRIRIDVPSYQGIKVTAEVHAAPTVRIERARAGAESALCRFINPLTGGPDGKGWPFDLDLSIGDIFAVLRSVPGIVRADAVSIFLVDLDGDLEPTEASQRVRLSREALFMSMNHRVVVRQ
jgi:predicted phage baseplate assembly protein